MASRNPVTGNKTSDEEDPHTPDEELPLRAYLVQTDYSKLDDTDEITILRFEYEELICRFETELYMHTLSAGYYHNRAFWFTFLPLLLVTTSVSICSFINTGKYDDSMVFDGNLTTAMSHATSDDTDFAISQGNLSLITGFLGVLSTFLASLGKHLNYESKGDMHISATNTLSSILEQILFEFMVFKKEARLTRQTKGDAKKQTGPTYTDEDLTKLRVNLETHQSKFDIMDKSCTVPIPNDILHAFESLRGIRDCIKQPKLKFGIYKRFSNDLFREFQYKGCFPLCPCYPPKFNVESMIEKKIQE